MAEAITAAQLRAIADGRAPFAVKIAETFNTLAASFGLTTALRQAHFFAQLSHESTGFKDMKERWGPTAAQRRYEGRGDLGNTQPGDGKRFMGRGPIQITGRSNYREFTAWIRKRNSGAPDFEAEPAKLEEFPWALMGAFWFWDTRGLNHLADADDVVAVTKKINGGTNGLADRRATLKRAKAELGVEAAPARAPARKQRMDRAAVSPAPEPVLAAPRVETVAAPSQAEARRELPFWQRWLVKKQKPASVVQRPGLKPGGNPELYDVQAQLRDRLYYTRMPPDGVDGPITQAAVTLSRKDHGLGDGGIDATFLAKLPSMGNRLIPEERRSATLRQAATERPELFGQSGLLGSLGLGSLGIGLGDGTGLFDKAQSAAGKIDDVAGKAQSAIGSVHSFVDLVAPWKSWILVAVGLFVLWRAARAVMRFLIDYRQLRY